MPKEQGPCVEYTESKGKIRCTNSAKHNIMAGLLHTGQIWKESKKRVHLITHIKISRLCPFRLQTVASSLLLKTTKGETLNYKLLQILRRTCLS